MRKINVFLSKIFDLHVIIIGPIGFMILAFYFIMF